jgi:hypothetical protein
VTYCRYSSSTSHVFGPKFSVIALLPVYADPSIPPLTWDDVTPSPSLGVARTAFAAGRFV